MVRQVWLKCPACGYTWRTYIYSDKDLLLGCNTCKTTEPMQVIDAPKGKKT